MNTKLFKNILFGYVLFTAAALVHYNALLNGIINWRDDELFYALHMIKNGSASLFGQEAYSPAMMYLYSLQFAIGGDGHFIYHAVSLLLHIANALLLFVLLNRFGASSMVAMFVSFIVAVHPVHAGSVAMVSNQPTLLALLLLQLTILSYSYFAEKGSRRYFFTSSLSAAALYFIGNPAVYPIVAVMLIRQSMKKDITWRSTLPFSAFWLLTLLGLFWSGEVFPYLWSLFQESVVILRFGMAEQFLQVFTPWSTALLPRSVQIVNSQPGISGILYPLVFIALSAGTIAYRKEHPFFFYGMVIVLFGSLPLSTGVSRGEWAFSEDGTYFPAIGWLLMGVGAVQLFAAAITTNRIFMKAAYTAMAAAGIALMVQTTVKCAYWENGKVYWDQCLAEQPEQRFALIRRGMYHYFRFEIDPALRSLTTAIQLDSNDFEARHSRGMVHLAAMSLPAATFDYQRALKIDSTSSNAHFGMGSIHSLYSRFDSAALEYSKAIRYDPGFYEAYANRATVYGSMGKYSSSFADFQKAQEVNPAFGQNYGNRGLVSLQIGNAQLAAENFSIQLSLEPNQVEPRIHAAFTAILLSDTAAAKLQFSKAREIDTSRTKLYLSTAKKTFLKTKRELELGEAILKQVFGNF